MNLKGFAADVPLSAARAAGPAAPDLKPFRPDRELQFCRAKSAMVSCSHPLATEAALDALRKGGSAVDACLTAAIVQTVVEPTMTTLAGGLGITYYEAESGQVSRVVGGFAKPKNESDTFTTYDYTTGRTVMVPGFVAAIHAASKKWGRLPWKDLFGSAIDLARRGFVIDKSLWGWTFEYVRFLGRYPEGREIWFPNGYLLAPGDVLVQHRLAATLERLAEEGPDFFYKGAWAQKFVQAVQDAGGKITLEDLAAFRTNMNGSWLAERNTSAPPPSVKGRYREYEVAAPSNALMVLALNLAELANLRDRGPPTESAESLYFLMRIVQEAWLAGFVYTPGTHDTIVSPEFARHLWELIEKGPPRGYLGVTAGTCAITVVDPQGNVAIGGHSSSSVPYGTGLIVDGVIANRVIFHRMVKYPNGVTPEQILLKDGKPVLALASPSQSYFTNALQNIVNVVEYGMDLWESVNQPMFGAAGPDGSGEDIEGTFDERIIREVERKGMQVMRVAPWSVHMGSCHAALIDRARGEIQGVADPRRLGCAQGF